MTRGGGLRSWFVLAAGLEGARDHPGVAAVQHRRNRPTPAARLNVRADMRPTPPGSTVFQLDRAQLDRAQLDRAQLDRAQLDRAQLDRAQLDRLPARPSSSSTVFQFDRSQLDRSQLDRAQLDRLPARPSSSSTVPSSTVPSSTVFSSTVASMTPAAALSRRGSVSRPRSSGRVPR
ncbi:MAG: pentapeptide repeat-containing protein [Deltaproteobacteria bacterium]|nr:pentapeptide repeat-containing protein [Deltaproteobacteria bacterium]